MRKKREDEGITKNAHLEEDLSRILESSTIPTCVINKEHRIAHWNAAMEALTGAREKDVVGTKRQWSLFYSKERPILADLIIDGAPEEEIERMYKGKYKKSNLIKGAYEGYDFFPAFGENGRWLEYTAAPLKNAKGDIIGALETARDITERKTFEEQVRVLKEFSENIVESTPVGIIVVDRNKTVTTCNKAVEELFGVGKTDATGKTICRDFLGNIGDVIEPLLEKTLREGCVTKILGVLYRDDTGRSSVLDVSISPLFSGGNITGAVITTDDITEKRKLRERVRVLERKDIPLTEKDKLVLYGLISRPELNDIALARRIRMKRSTLTGIKNKLAKAGFYSTVVVPNLSALGYELLTVNYGSFLPHTEKHGQEMALREELRQPEYVRIVFTGIEYMTLSASKNITEYREKRDPIEAMYDEAGILKDCRTIHFPLGLCKIKSLFDYGPPMGNWFKLEAFGKPKKKAWRNGGYRNLTGNEKRILYALTKHPGMPDRGIAELTGLNKVTVSSTRKRLTEEGYMKTARVPDLGKMGCELMLVIHSRFNPAIKRDVREKVMDDELPDSSTCVMDMRESISITPFKDFTEYKTVLEKYMGIQDKNKLFLNDPETLLIPVKKIAIDHIDFAPLVKKALDVEEFF